MRPPVKQPRWKILFSYLTEWHIESAPSEINPHLYVSLRKGRYQLSTANAVYSYDDLYDNFRGAFSRFRFDHLPGKQTLILGLGLGSVPFMLEHTFQQRLYYTAIEKDENVIYLAEKYSLNRIQSPLTVICADALRFVEQCRETFDLIVMDIFLDDIIPSPFQQESFLKDLRKLLSPAGVLLFNRLASQRTDIEKTRLYYNKVFGSVFPEAGYLDLDGNWILFSDRRYIK